jgi:hypothetical protein
MNEPVVNTPPQDSSPREILSLDRVISIIWESAVQSFIRAILVVVFGSIAISMASGIWEEMAPSRPPGFGHQPEAEATTSGPRPAWGTWFSEHRFLIIFGLIFVLTLWFRLIGRKQDAEESRAEFHLGKITHHLSENWFGLIVGNAFGALISAIVLVWVQRFTFASLVFHWLLESMLASLQNLAQHLVGTGRAYTVQAWFSWYGDNQLRFTFWFFYLSAICDDLGIPNFKTLGRRLGRKLLNRIKHQEAL